MLIPPVDYCLLCEDIRPEPGNKITVLGFFGVLPTVGVVVLPDEVSNRMMFMVMFGKCVGEYSIAPHLLNPRNVLIASGTPLLFKINPAASGTIGGFGFSGIRFNEDGLYSFQLTVGNKEIYRSSFKVEIGQIPDFKA